MIPPFGLDDGNNSNNGDCYHDTNSNTNDNGKSKSVKNGNK